MVTYSTVVRRDKYLQFSTNGTLKNLFFPVWLTHEEETESGVEFVVMDGIGHVRIFVHAMDQASLAILRGLERKASTGADGGPDSVSRAPIGSGWSVRGAVTPLMEQMRMEVVEGVLSLRVGNRSEDYVLESGAIPIVLEAQADGDSLLVRLQLPGRSGPILGGIVAADDVDAALRAVALCKFYRQRSSASSGSAPVTPQVARSRSARRAHAAALFVEVVAWLGGLLGVILGILVAVRKSYNGYGELGRHDLAFGLGIVAFATVQTAVYVMVAAYVASRTE